MSRALEHYLEHAAQVHLPAFDSWFPTTFDWARLCADVPDMARRVGHPAAGAEEERALEEMAAVVFRGAHLFALAVLGAAPRDASDPEDLLERLASPPDEEEEAVFADLVGCCLHAVESLVFSEREGGTADERVERGAALVLAIWPAVTHVLSADDSRIFERAGASADVLWGVARVGVVLAAFRWMAASACQGDWPELPLDD